MGQNLNSKNFAAMGSIDEMVLDISIVGSWQTGAARQVMVAAQSNTTVAPQQPPVKKVFQPRTLVVYEGYQKWRADAITKTLLRKFLPAFVISTRRAKRDKFQVQVGPFATEAETNYARAKLRRAGYPAKP
jgi:cell division septation protein DedD